MTWPGREAILAGMGDARPMPWVETIKADFGITVSH
jgi:hypothetical protein